MSETETNDNVKVVTTYTSQMDGEVEVEPEQCQPPAPPEAETITASTSDSQNAITAEEGVSLKDPSLKDYRETGDGSTTVTSYEPPDSSRHRSEESFEDYQRELDRLKFPGDRELLQQISEQGEAPPPQRQSEANMIPVEQVGELVEQQVIIREHHQRMAQALQDPDFAAYLSSAPVSDVVWAPEIGTAVAAQANSPVVVAYLSANPELAQQIASMPVPRGLAEVSKLSAWLQTQLQPQSTAPRRVLHSAAPPPIRPLGGSPTTTNAIDLNTCDYQTYRRARDRRRGTLHSGRC